ncbi:hypothetical protein E143388_07278 [Rhodococcus opacus]|nr:hypothetical protein E143388_07278 [Rhodococcus opacus]
MRRVGALVAVFIGIAVFVAAFMFHSPSEICRGHHPFPEDVLDQYGFVIAEQHFTRARAPLVAAHCTLQLVSGPRTAGWPGGISPPGSHRTVLNSLPLHGSSHLIRSNSVIHAQ